MPAPADAENPERTTGAAQRKRERSAFAVASGLLNPHTPKRKEAEKQFQAACKRDLGVEVIAQKKMKCEEMHKREAVWNA